jgi:hypothetical protein
MRVLTQEKVGSFDEARALDGLVVSVDGVAVFEGSSGSDGIVEARADARPGPHAISVTHGGETLTSGTVEAPTRAMEQAAPGVSGATRGPGRITVDLERGSLAAPFGEALEIVATDADGAPIHGPAKVTIDGGTVASESVALDDAGRGATELVGIADTVEIAVSVAGPRGALEYAGRATTRMGSLWVDPRSTRDAVAIAVRAPHDRAYVSFWDDRGRVGGASVALDAEGALYRGVVEPADTTSARLVALVATDPEERGLSTVAWPVDPRRHSFEPARLVRALDGLAPAAEREARRERRVHLVVVVFLCAAAALEIGLLAWESRRTRRALAAHFAENAGDEGDIPDGGAAKLVTSKRDDVLVVGAVALLLILAGATLAALSVVGR